MFAGAVATVTAIVMVKLLGKLPIFSVRAALAEHEREKKVAKTDGADRLAGEGE